nr:thioesterase family protein [Marinithermofilum abyssi]
MRAILIQKSGERLLVQHIMELTVRSTDLDMLGHVNNAKYFEYLEWGRFEWMKQIGLGMEEMTRRGILPVVVNVNVNYRQELKLDEKIQVISKPLRLGNKSNTLYQEIRNEKGEKVCDAEITGVVLDALTRQVTELPEEFKAVFQAFVEC